MNINEAIEICEGWFAYLERQKQKAARVAELSAMARNGQQAEAQRLLRQLDTNSITVYDGGRLEPAVRLLVKLQKKPPTTNSVQPEQPDKPPEQP